MSKSQSPERVWGGLPARALNLKGLTEHDVRKLWKLPMFSNGDPILRILERKGFMDRATVSELSSVIALHQEEAMMSQTTLEKIHRVQFASDKIYVLSLGLTLNEPEGTYTDPTSLPSWIQDRIAVLSMMSFEPPTKFVEGVGRRIDENVFWVVEPETVSE